MKALLFAWASLAALAISLAPAVFRSDRPPMPFATPLAGYGVSLPAPVLQAGWPIKFAGPLAGEVAPRQAVLPDPALNASVAVATTLPATAQSTRTWEQRWAVTVLLVGAALGLLALELVRRLERGYLESP